MFSTDSIIKEVNIINKVLCYAMVLISLLICKETVFLVFVNLVLLLITKQYDNLFKVNVFVVLCAVASIFYPHLLWITKFGIIIIYTGLLNKVTRSIELRYLLETTLYRFKQRKVTYKILNIIYFNKYFNENLRRLLVLKDDYGLKYNVDFISFIIRKAYYKTEEQMKDFIKLNKLRFYNISSKRTYVEKIVWESWDTNYIIVHIIILLFTWFYGR